MRSLVTRLIGVILLVFSCPGCGSYWRDRVRDLDQCFLVAGYAGIGAFADAKVGPLDSGLGLGGGWGIGKPHWWAWEWSFTHLNIGLVAIHVLGDDPEFIMFEYGRASILGLSFLAPLSDLSAMRKNLARGRGPNGVYSYTGWVVDDFFGIEVSAFAFLGGRVGFNLAEFADFVTGWFGVDLVPDGIEMTAKKALEGGERKTDPRAGRDGPASTPRASHD